MQYPFKDLLKCTCDLNHLSCVQLIQKYNGYRDYLQMMPKAGLPITHMNNGHLLCRISGNTLSFILMTTGSIKFYQRSAVVPTQEHIFSKTKSNQNQIVEFIINIIEKQDFAQYALFEA